MCKMAKKTNKKKKILFAFDTTGSMYPCLTQVRNVVEQVTKDLFGNIKDLMVGIVAFGDYCDGDRCITELPFTDNVADICSFVRTAPQTDGGDSDECYELVLHRARKFDWSGSDSKAVVLIGDCNPHQVGYRLPNGKVNMIHWADEAQLLVDSGVLIYPIQAMGRREASAFYSRLATISRTPKLELPQFSDIVDILSGVTYHQAGQLEQFQSQLGKRAKAPSAHVLRTLAQLSGATLSNRSETIGSKYQVLDVPEKTDIKSFVLSTGADFHKGDGFYEWTKTETIQEKKHVVAQNKKTGAIIEGVRARKALGLPAERGDFKPDPKSNYVGFIQSTSVNRALVGGTKFLYKVREAEGLET